MSKLAGVSSTDAHVIGRVMDKAAGADRRALFAALQTAIGEITDLRFGMSRRDPYLAIEESLDVGAPYGSPERIAYDQSKIASRSGE